MIGHPDMPTFKNNRKFGCIILVEWKEGLRSSKVIGKDFIRLPRRSMMSFSASRRHKNTKRRSFILINWQPITIGNFFCSTHGYFRTVVFPVRRRANARAGTEVRYHSVPTPHLCPRITDKTLPTDDDMMIPNNEDSTILRDGSSDRTSQGSTRLKVDDF